MESFSLNVGTESYIGYGVGRRFNAVSHHLHMGIYLLGQVGYGVARPNLAYFTWIGRMGFFAYIGRILFTT